LRNYLLRLGWSHGDDEIISTAQAIEWFDLDALGKSPARFDFAKLANLNGRYIREADDKYLMGEIVRRYEKEERWEDLGINLDSNGQLGTPEYARLFQALEDVKPRATTLNELADRAVFYVQKRPLPIDNLAKTQLTALGFDLLAGLTNLLAVLPTDWNDHDLETLVRNYAESKGQKLGTVAQPLRIALTGSTNSPPLFAVMR